MNQSTTATTTKKTTNLIILAPSQVIQGKDAFKNSFVAISRFGKRPLIVGGNHSLKLINPYIKEMSKKHDLDATLANYSPDCAENSISLLLETAKKHSADFIIGVGGGKALDTAKLLAHKCGLPIVTVPTSAATCAAWSALSNIYSEKGAFLYDVPLDRCPDLLILDYDLIQTAPQRTLVAGIGDAMAKWYEASVSSGNKSESLTIAAVQQARVLRDILFQKAVEAIANPGGEQWCEVVDATVLLPGVIGGLGGANCRTVAAHAIHNGLTHISAAHGALHGEKVAYGILVQLRLEEMVQGNQLAETARQQLIKFYKEIGLPTTLEELGLKDVTLAELRHSVSIALKPSSDIHRLPFVVHGEQLLAAMVSTTIAARNSHP